MGQQYDNCNIWPGMLSSQRSGIRGDGQGAEATRRIRGHGVSSGFVKIRTGIANPPERRSAPLLPAGTAALRTRVRLISPRRAHTASAPIGVAIALRPGERAPELFLHCSCRCPPWRERMAGSLRLPGITQSAQFRCARDAVLSNLVSRLHLPSSRSGDGARPAGGLDRRRQDRFPTVRTCIT
jgi:hypothetical protein